MAGILYCLPLTSDWLKSEDEHAQSDLQECLGCLQENRAPLIVTAETGSGKSVMLFQAGVAYASQDYHVTLISPHQLSRIPLSIHGMIRPDTAGKLQTLTFLYMNKISDLLEFCASVHTKPLVPDVLLIDDLDFYLSQLTEPSIEAGCARLCAILSDALAFIKSKSCVGVLIASCNRGHTQWQQVFKQFHFTLADITAINQQNREFKLVVNTNHVNMTVNYQVKNSGVYVTDLEADFIQSGT